LFEIAGARVGLLGMGYVGRRSAQRFQAIGAEVWAYDPYLSPEKAQSLGVRKAELDELLSQCLVISVHLPVTQETHHLLGARELALIQDGAVFINTARAWVVDQQAMIAELATGRFWAALDVFDPEPLPVDHPLRRMDNVLLTPHIAGLTQNSYHDLMTTMVAEAERLAKGEPLQYQVTRDMLATMA
jgi:phosphoglycerate dehydrogenase-like enzyme